MSLIEIRHRDGETQKRRLSRDAPLLIGSSPFSDIRIDAHGIAAVHCRIGWTKTGYEITAATQAGVQLNGATVRNEHLHEGDIVRVGDVELVVMSLTSLPKSRLAPPAKAPPRAVAVSDELEIVSSPEWDFSGEPAEPDSASPGGVKADIARRKPGPRAVRPGEQDVLRSPLVLGLGGGTLFLLLTSATLWFILGRESVQREYDAAQASLNNGLYSQSIEAFEAFIQNHSRHKLAGSARVALGKARVDQSIAGATPAWDRGLKALEEFIAQNRDTEDFKDPQSEVRKFVVKSAGGIALGAAESSARDLKRPLLEISAEGSRLLELYEPTGAPELPRREAIADAVTRAQAALLRREVFEKAVGRIDDELKSRRALAALKERRRLLERYADFKDQRPLKERLAKTLVLEQSLVLREELDRPALTEPRALPGIRPLSLTRRTRTRSDEHSIGELVFAVAEDCCYGVDTMTGEPVWRQVVGLDTPFFPQLVSASVPALLAFDTAGKELLLLNREAGKLIWRQPLPEIPIGVPLIKAGQILLSTASGSLYQVDLETGRLTARLKFPQNLAGGPVLAHSGERLYVAGNQDVLYVLQRSPLACDKVVFLGQGAGSIQAPMLMMRDYLLIAENDRLKSCQLRVLDTKANEALPVPLDAIRINGQVRDTPVIRGRQLFVPSSPESVSAFTVSETKTGRALTLVGTYQAKDAEGGPIFLTAGPDDQIWMAGTALRKLLLEKDSLLADKVQIAAGLSSQPLQSIGESLFVGRRLPYSRAVLFTKADRQRMQGQWQVALGAAVLDCSDANPKDESFHCVTSIGDLFRVTPESLAVGGFDYQSSGQLSLPETTAVPLRATRCADGRLAISSGGADRKLWILSVGGAVQQELKLARDLEAGPVPLAGGFLVGFPGRLSLIGQRDVGMPVEDLLMPIGAGEPPRWKQLRSLDGGGALTLDANGRVARVEFRPMPVPHLTEVAHWDAGRPIDTGLLVEQGRVIVTDVDGRIVALDARSLEIEAQGKLDAPATRAISLLGSQLLVECGGTTLICYEFTDALKEKWKVPLQGGGLAGPPQSWNDKLVVVLRDGQIRVVDPSTGATVQEVALGQGVCLGPRLIGKSLVVGTLDGSLYLLNSLLK